MELHQRCRGIRSVCAIVLLLLCVQGEGQRRQPIDKSVQATSWGRVTGRVYDAESGMPVVGALVAVRHDGSFQKSGRTAGVTDALGRYSVQALLGRVSENFDVGRALSSGLIGILAGGATNRTKRVDVTRLNISVSADGFKPFRGSCPCRSLDANSFTVSMEPIVLVRKDSPEASAVAPGWGAVRIVDVGVEPAIIRPGQDATLRAIVRVPAQAVKDVEVVAVSSLWGTKRLAAQKQTGGSPVVYTVTVKAPKVRSGHGDTVRFLITKSPLDVVADNPIRRYVQVAEPSEEDLAQQRLAAHGAWERGEGASSLRLWKTVCADPRATVSDHLQLAEAAQSQRDYRTAAEALQRAVALEGSRPRPDIVARHAEALVLSGQAQQVLASYGPIVSETREGERPKKASPALLAAVGQSYLQVGDLEGAARIRKALDTYQTALPQSALVFRSALRLAETSAAVRANPGDGARQADYGRALLDVGRWEEALEPLRAAKKLGGPEAVDADIEYALWRIAGKDGQTERYAPGSLEEARARVLIDEGKKQRKSKDFWSWHELAMLLYDHWDRTVAESEGQATLKECMEALAEAVKCARSGARVDEGLYSPYLGYAQSRTVAIAGYAYAEAASDAALLESLRVLAENPEDEFALLNRAEALVELGRTAAAARALDACRLKWQSDPHVQFLEAKVAAARGEGDVAIGLLRSVLAANPRHREAYLELARLLTIAGRMPDAAAVLLSHAEAFGGHEARDTLGGSR